MSHLPPENILDLYSPDVIFSLEFQKNHPDVKQHFEQYFQSNYQFINQFQEINYSTNHITYLVFQNLKNNDIRIIRQVVGCFSSEQKFVSLDFIRNEIHSIEEEKTTFCKKLPKNKILQTELYFNSRIESLEKIFTLCEQLDNHSNKALFIVKTQ